MGDDFFDDMDGMDDSFGDPSDDFQEDLFDEHNDGGLDGLTNDAGPESVLPEDGNNSDNAKAVIMGGMIAGQAYSEGKELRGQEKLRWLMKQQDKRKK